MAILAGALAATAIGLTLAVGALASGSAPKFNSKDLKYEVHATRVRAQFSLTASEGVPLDWQAEYATTENGPWTLVSSAKGVILQGDDTIEREIGDVISVPSLGSQVLPTVYHLRPAKVYYLRFRAENEYGEAQETVELATPAVEKPEISPTGTYGLGEFPPGGSSSFNVAGEPHSAEMSAVVDGGGATSEYRFDYAPAENGPWTVCGSGTVTVAEDVAVLKQACTGLHPETGYFGRLTVSNEKGTVSEVEQFTTETAKPRFTIGSLEAYNVKAASAGAVVFVVPQGSPTHWHFELAESESGPWTSWTAGFISQSRAEAMSRGAGVFVSGMFSGLKPATVYYVRVVAESECSDGCGRTTSAVKSFETTGPPLAKTFQVHATHGESLRALGAVDPNSVPTLEEQSITVEGAPTGGTFTLSFNGHVTAPIAYDALAQEGEGPGSVQRALRSIDVPFRYVLGAGGGPYTIIFRTPEDEPQVQADASGLTPSGSVSVAMIQQGGEGYSASYRFEYLSEEQFRKQGERFENAASTAFVQLGVGGVLQGVGADLPAGLQPGETYRYRIVASNTTPGNPVVDGAEQTLTVPNPSIAAQPACENERFRTGLSAHLPDCRAFEQISPIDKEGAQEALNYELERNLGAIVGEDGDHFMFMSDSTRWGTGVDAGLPPYFFSRTPQGWRMTAGTPEPEAGFDHYEPQVFGRDLEQFAFLSRWTTEANGPGTGLASSKMEYKAGPPGGPYATIATVPNKEQELQSGGWVAASEDFSKLLLATEDHKLAGRDSGTVQGYDLYEYSAGKLSLANVGSAGHAIGSCGANVVTGDEPRSSGSRPGSRNAVSGDGSRVFFEAVPGTDCTQAHHLYMREAGAGRTLDIGAYRFVAANREGSKLLLEKVSGEVQEFFLYDTGSAALTPAFSIPDNAAQVIVSRDFDAVAIATQAQLTQDAPPVVAAFPRSIYRYDIAAKTLRFIAQTRDSFSGAAAFGGGVALGHGWGEMSPDGRFLYFHAQGVAGLPSAGPRLHPDGSEGPDLSEQLYRFDSSEDDLECVSCASPFDPEPRLGLDNAGGSLSTGWPSPGQPEVRFTSSNGDYAFFGTPAALVAQDVNGEIAPEDGRGNATRLIQSTPSNDVYEWRREGVDGCARLQGCISLITPGTDGYLVVLLGAAAEGHDVFLYTSSQLLLQDIDTAGDFYDARIGGGIPEASKPVECEGDACLSVAPGPLDATPASLSFSGPGDPVASPVVSRPKSGRCGKGHVRKKGRCVRARRRSAHAGRGHRSRAGVRRKAGRRK